MSDKFPGLKYDNVCPSCGSQSIKSGAVINDKEGLRGSNRIPIDAQATVTLDNYLCLDCGYTESYISDRAMLNHIAKNWQKVEAQRNET